ncbi:MAG: DUF2169 domain-containing protein [Planctomycetes bacterium]|nr:DUF2169 domain-containing protein [Planctomycetota bacterium]
MRIVNETPFPLAWLVGSIRPPQRSVSFVVKASFDLVHGASAALAAEQAPIAPDTPHATPPAKGSLAYVADLVPFKPRADLLLDAHCFTPKGKPLGVCGVRFALGSWSKSLGVIGDRVWHRGLLGSTASDPLPFKSMAIRYENALGGEKYAPNPAGKGFDDDVLPNVETPGALVTSPRQKAAPAGFGPHSAAWPQRAGKTGTYNKKWLQTRWPWYPEDFDWTFFNAAPPDQQLPAFLKGDEEILFENMHPELDQLKSRLPALRCRLFIETVKGEFKEVPLALDTLWACPHELKLVLVWRGQTEIAHPKLREFRNLLLVSEPMKEAPLGLPHYRALLEERLTAEARATAAEQEADDKQDAASDAEIDAAEKEADAMHASTEKAVAEGDSQIAASEAQLEAHLKSLRSAQGPSGVDPALLLSAPARAASPAEIAQTYGVWLADLQKTNAELAKLYPPPAELQKDLEEEEAEPEPDEDEVEADWTRKRCVEHAKARGSFAEADLTGLDLSGLDFSGLDFTEAVLTKANLANARFDGANLTEASLQETDSTGAAFVKANLESADLSRAVLAKVSFVSAQLRDAVLTQAALSGTDFSGAQCVRAEFTESVFKGALLTEANFEYADFTQAQLQGAHFSKCRLVDATFEGAKAASVRFEGCDLSKLRAGENADFAQADFTSCTATRAVFDGSVLTKAFFRGTRLERASFEEAILEGADFTAAILKHVAFIDAKLAKAVFLKADLFRASFERAALPEADCRGANCYEAEFLESDTTRARFDLAILTGTKLA